MNDKVSYLKDEYRQQAAELGITEASRKKGGGGGHEPPEGKEMEARVAALEKAIPDIRDRLVRVEVRLDGIEANMATKVDLANLASKDDLSAYVRASGKDIQDLAVSFHKTMNEQTWKFIGVATALAGIAFTAAKFIHP